MKDSFFVSVVLGALMLAAPAHSMEKIGGKGKKSGGHVRGSAPFPPMSEEDERKEDHGILMRRLQAMREEFGGADECGVIYEEPDRPKYENFPLQGVGAGCYLVTDLKFSPSHENNRSNKQPSVIENPIYGVFWTKRTMVGDYLTPLDLTAPLSTSSDYAHIIPYTPSGPSVYEPLTRARQSHPLYWNQVAEQSLNNASPEHNGSSNQPIEVEIPAHCG